MKHTTILKAAGFLIGAGAGAVNGSRNDATGEGAYRGALQGLGFDVGLMGGFGASEGIVRKRYGTLNSRYNDAASRLGAAETEIKDLIRHMDSVDPSKERGRKFSLFFGSPLGQYNEDKTNKLVDDLLSRTRESMPSSERDWYHQGYFLDEKKKMFEEAAGKLEKTRMVRDELAHKVTGLGKSLGRLSRNGNKLIMGSSVASGLLGLLGASMILDKPSWKKPWWERISA